MAPSLAHSSRRLACLLLILIVFLVALPTQQALSQKAAPSLASRLKPFAPLLGWLALASAPIYGRGEFEGKAGGLGSMTEFSRLENRNGPTVVSNEYIVAPRGAAPRARVVEAPVFDGIPAEKLYTIIDKTIRKEGNIEFVKADEGTLRLEFVQRTPLFRFPDIITLQAIPAGTGSSSVAIHSYSIYGAGDLGVNKARVQRFLEEIKKESSVSSSSTL